VFGQIAADLKVGSNKIIKENKNKLSLFNFGYLISKHLYNNIGTAKATVQ
tara:strand:+ start:389 stop:538 length:150 start_codon:yes stop_codon:yes gene_type:complete